MTNSIYSKLPTTIFEVMSSLSREHGALNLGQGFPDEPGPIGIRSKAAAAVVDGPHQYPPSSGLPELREAVAGYYRRYQNLSVDWRDEVTITSGATEALAASIFGLIEPGDEVVLFQPLYDAYLPLVRRAGGVPRLMTLTAPHFRCDHSELRAAFSDKARLLVINSPINPAAVVFTEEDLQLIAELCVRFNVTAVCDEVWEHIVFDGLVHRSLMTYPGMRERTVKIGSAGKLFSLTGWKVGFMIAAPSLTLILRKAHQFLSFSTPPNLQVAVAWGLENSDLWFSNLPAELQHSRDTLTNSLRAMGFYVPDSKGTYFINVDLPASGIVEDDMTFCLRAVREHGIAAIPLSAFYELSPLTTMIRLCFAKPDGTLRVAAERLARARDTAT